MRRNGFTLIEVAVAIGIMMAVLGVAGIMFAGVQKSWQRSSEHNNRLLQLQTIDRVMDNAVRNAVPFYWLDRNRKEVMLFTGETDGVFLTSLHRVNQREKGGIRFMKLYAESGNLVAEYSHTPIVAETDSEAGNVQKEIIAEGVSKVHFHYADLKDGELYWFEVWDPVEMRNIPVAINMEVTFADGTKESWLRRTAGAGQFQQLGRRLPASR